LTLFIGGASGRDAERKIIAGGGLWYGGDNAKNKVLRVPGSQPQTAQAALITASLLGAQHTSREQPLKIHCAKSTVRVAMTQQIQDMEDRGWIGVINREPLRALAAELTARTAPTIFEDGDPNGNGQILEGRAGAARLAKDGCQGASPSQINLNPDPAFSLRGAKLATLTQAIAYAGIKELKGVVSRNATSKNIELVTEAVKHNFGRVPTAEQIWKSIRNKDFTRQLKNFLYKSLHSAHKIGPYWKHIPECEERGICQFCNETEDLEHILLRCRKPGQQLVWSLAKDLWLKKHPSWPIPSLGSILGCGLASFNDEKRKHLPGTSRLYRILISESAFVIWKLRNESVIKKQGENLPDNLIRNKWLYAINLRLHFDCVLTNHAKYGKQNSINTSLVLQTWSSTLMNEEELPENWIKSPRVLVGTEEHSSHSAPQPSGCRGRNR
ncbi:ribonuclease H-like protein, partial [Mycena epipterygia]